MVDYFIKPPVIVTFTFEKPIWISHIKLGTQVGQQQSKGVEILIDDTRIARKVNDNRNIKDIYFQNFAFPGNKFDGQESDKIRLGQTQLLKSVKSFQIRIFLTFQSSVACLANIQIWGLPSPDLSAKIKTEIRSIWEALIKAKTGTKRTFEQISTNQDGEASSSKLEHNSGEIDIFI